MTRTSTGSFLEVVRKGRLFTWVCLDRYHMQPDAFTPEERHAFQPVTEALGELYWYRVNPGFMSICGVTTTADMYIPTPLVTLGVEVLEALDEGNVYPAKNLAPYAVTAGLYAKDEADKHPKKTAQMQAGREAAIRMYDWLVEALS